MKKFLQVLPILGASLAPIFAPQVSAYIAAHPDMALWVGAAMQLLHALAPSLFNRSE